MSGLEPGFHLGHYRITRSLGSGGMADVYEAHDENLDRIVALKILPMEYSRNQQLVQRFQKEVRAAAKLNHRNIVTVFEVGQQDSWHFFSMRLLTGGDLRARIEAGLTPIEGLAILREVADAFAHAHARGFVHRDVKPENIMFDEQGFPVLTDFGIAKALDANTHMTRTGMTMGTPRYLSPEQASGKPVDARADLYSLGIILHEMLTGRPPYDAEEAMAVIFKHVTEPIPVLPPDFLRYQPLLEKLMAKDANQRIASATDLVKEIDALFPRTGSGEFKQSALRTMENPLIQQLMTPSPMRTPAPRTPAPVTPPPVRPAPTSKPMTAPPASAGIDVRPPPVQTRRPTLAPAAMPAAPAGATPETAASPTAPRSRTGLLIGVIATAGGIAIAGYTAWRAMQPDAVPPAPVVAPATSPAAAQVEETRKANAEREQQRRAEKQRAETQQAEQLRLQQQREAQAAAQRQQAETEARNRAQSEAAAREQARREAAAKQQAETEAQSRRREAAEAEARRQAEAEARRRAEAEAQKRADDEAASTSAAEIERRAREADRAAAAKRRGGKPAEEKPAEEKAKAKPVEPEKKRPDESKPDESKEEEEALERSRRPTGF
ncbi:MAG TPA: protein kinase [Verrucomicrobiae bacterium]|nr:protein kinase [Verrucomicrobiae bacterium]